MTLSDAKKHGTFVVKTVHLNSAEVVRVDFPFGIGDEFWKRLVRSSPKTRLVDLHLAYAIEVRLDEILRDDLGNPPDNNPFESSVSATVRLWRDDNILSNDDLGFNTRIVTYMCVIRNSRLKTVFGAPARRVVCESAKQD